ncbi:SAG-related sequence [Besnoitia besnoiti]|uniref:SAG-related sequence n=1 Tax=Besnoitia besnoiti TaxID=94643 RepID=A0A2A9MDY2_BESBE|nr:SAG-related sequence [Besnoitia besnoiti]PFH36089.1 SAG-related sequence [Besnoitia besnoiti]
MASARVLACRPSQAGATGVKGGVQRRGLLPLRLRVSVLALFAATALCSGSSSPRTIHALAVNSLSAECGASGHETTCICAEASLKTSEQKSSAVISKETNVLEVDCKGELKFAPTGAGNSLVCPAGSDGLNNCQLDINKLLTKQQNAVQWQNCDQESKVPEQCKSLTIPEESLPFADEGFSVGCVDKTQGDKKLCQVAVTIKARASETNGQTVTCAYGASSNESRQAVTLNPSKNSFTLVCGDKGTVLPTNYETKFCSSDPEKAKETCDGDYQSILPGFEEGWWKNDDPTANSFTLSIPVEKFPKEQAKMVVACQQEKESSGSKTVQWEAATSSVCRVDVTIEAGSPASLSLGSRHFSSWLLAFAVTFVMARGI